MAASRSTDILPETEFDLKHEPAPETIPLEESLSSGSSSLVDDKTFLKVPGEEAYVPIDKYEGRHRYDPSFRWSADEEKKLVRTIDIRICAWVCLTFFVSGVPYVYISSDFADLVQSV